MHLSNKEKTNTGVASSSLRPTSLAREAAADAEDISKVLCRSSVEEQEVLKHVVKAVEHKLCFDQTWSIAK